MNNLSAQGYDELRGCWFIVGLALAGQHLCDQIIDAPASIIEIVCALYQAFPHGAWCFLNLPS